MPGNNIASLVTLPVELIYRILDHLAPKDIFLSVRNVCERLNSITDVYHPYQVNLTCNFLLHFHQFRSIIFYRNQPCVVLHNLDRSVSVWLLRDLATWATHRSNLCVVLVKTSRSFGALNDVRDSMDHE